MAAVVYLASDASALESIRPLWTQLNDFHLARSRHFRHHYETMTFYDRKLYFQSLAKKGSLRVDIARDPTRGRNVGYCVTSLSLEKQGELESIFVEPAYRLQHIGSALMARALTWLEDSGAVRIRVSVGQGNEAAWDFYRKFGFYPRLTVLEIPHS